MYVGGDGAVDVFGPDLVIPDVTVTEPVSSLKARSATLNGTVNPAGAGEATCEFEYGTSTSYGSFAECTGSGSKDTPVPEGDVAVPVHVNLTGLQPDTTYHYRLSATNAGKLANTGECPEDCGQFHTPGPGIPGEWVTKVTSTSASLDATIAPNGAATSFYFQYGTSASYGNSVPLPEGSAGAGSGEVPVDVLVEGLSPDTVYHDRVVAVSEAAGERVIVEGADRTFTTQVVDASSAAVTLPDARQWEMVSPPDKRGVSLEAITKEGGLIQAAEGGAALAYIAKAPIDAEPAGSRSSAAQQLLAKRGLEGWSTQDIATPHESVSGLFGGNLSEYKVFSPDLSVGLVEPRGATPLSPAASERTPYLRNDGECEPTPSEATPATCYVPLANPADVSPPGTKFGEESGVQFEAAAPDLGHVVITATKSLIEGFQDEAGRQALYEWSGGTLQPVSILPGGSSATVQGGAALGRNNNVVRNTISADGSRVIFETGTSHLFMRDMARGETVWLDKPGPGIKEPVGGSPTYEDASSDGSMVFFTDPERLVVGAPLGGSHSDLYACRMIVEAGKLTCQLSEVAAEVDGLVAGVSEDGSYVYFVANSKMTVAHESAGKWTSTAIATLSANDGPDNPTGSEVSENLSDLTARVSPNGRYLAFMSQASLTGFDNRDAVTGVPDEEVYEYDAVSGRLACASCNPTGARPIGLLDRGEEAVEGSVSEAPLVDRPEVWHGERLAGSIPGWTPTTGGSHAIYQSRYLDSSGRLFFNSPVGLVPQDTNGKEDVYEYEPERVGPETAPCGPGVESRTEVFKPARTYEAQGVDGEGSAGCVGLISSGTSNEESAFLDASGMGPSGEEGEDVFFLTAARLSPSDTDNALDVYDAHTCSAVSPCPSPAVSMPLACTTADSCRQAPPAQPTTFGNPPSALFSGPGNLTPFPPAKRPTAAQLRAKRLAVALKACRKYRSSKRRSVCERQARKRYGSANSASKSRKAGRVSNQRRPK